MTTYLILTLEGEYFAISVLNVLEVMQKQKITSVPKTPPYILGVVNFRGDILPVVETRCKFGFKKLDPSDKFIVIIIEIEDGEHKHRIAITADSVVDVVEVTELDIKAVPDQGLNFDSRFIAGAVRRKDETILLLDIEQMFLTKDAPLIQ